MEVQTGKRTYENLVAHQDSPPLTEARTFDQKQRKRI